MQLPPSLEQQPVIYVCDTCGGTNVETHAMVAWNVADQEWYIVKVKPLGEIFGYHDDICHDCLAETGSLETNMLMRHAALKEISISVIKKEEALV
jgi:hypothetical protein